MEEYTKVDLSLVLHTVYTSVYALVHPHSSVFLGVLLAHIEHIPFSVF